MTRKEMPEDVIPATCCTMASICARMSAPSCWSCSADEELDKTSRRIRTRSVPCSSIATVCSRRMSTSGNERCFTRICQSHVPPSSPASKSDIMEAVTSGPGSAIKDVMLRRSIGGRSGTAARAELRGKLGETEGARKQDISFSAARFMRVGDVEVSCEAGGRLAGSRNGRTDAMDAASTVPVSEWGAQTCFA